MKYSKPEVTLCESALGQIQGMSKPLENDLDSNQIDYTTVSAYAADE
jgi:hypothetical protein